MAIASNVPTFARKTQHGVCNGRRGDIRTIFTSFDPSTKFGPPQLFFKLLYRT